MINLLFQYRSLLSLSVKHAYYKAKIPAKAFRMVATPYTTRLISSLGLLLKADDNGLHLLADLERKETLLARMEREEPVKLSFWVYTNNPYFINITDLPSENIGKVLYFNNLNKANTAGQLILLHKNETAGTQDLFPVNNNWRDLFIPDEASSISLKDEEGKYIFQKVAGSEAYLKLEKSDLLEGKYQLITKEGEDKTFIYPGKNTALNPLGFIDLILTDEMRKQIIQSIREDNSMPQFQYGVAFQPRSTYWKYFVVPKYSNGLNETNILTNDRKIKFSGPEKVSIFGGTEAWMFCSNQPLTLQEIPDYNFQLRKGNGNGKVLINRLPAPLIENVKPESRKSDSKVFSEIIVYI